MVKFIKKRKEIIINFISILIFIFLVIYLINNRYVFNIIKNINLVDFLLVSITTIILINIDALINFYLLRRINNKIKFSDCLFLQFANNLLNRITSHTGLIFRGFFLKNIYNIDLSYFFSMIAGIYIISFGTNSFVGLISSYVIYKEYGIYNFAIISLFLFTFFCTIILMSLSPEIKIRDGFIRRNLGKIVDGWLIIKANPKMILFFVTLSVLVTSGTALQQNFIFRSMGVEISISRLFLLSSISNLTLLISITPSGIGIREAVYAFSNLVVNINLNILLLSSMLTNVITFFTALVFGGMSYLLLARRLKRYLEC